MSGMRDHLDKILDYFYSTHYEVDPVIFDG